MLNLIRNINNSIVILLCLGILIFGIAGDLSSLYSILENLFFTIYIKDELIYTIFQIQVTLSTLTIAMVALVTNRVDKEIYGVALADYFMHKKYGMLCQINIIVVIIFLNMVSLCSYIFNYYTLIFSVLWCIIILLLRILGCVSMVMLPEYYGRKVPQIR